MQRAWEVLAELEGGRHQGAARMPRGRCGPSPQMPLFGGRSLLRDEILQLDIDSLTPLEAINKLYELRRKAGGEEV